MSNDVMSWARYFSDQWSRLLTSLCLPLPLFAATDKPGLSEIKLAALIVAIARRRRRTSGTGPTILRLPVSAVPVSFTRRLDHDGRQSGNQSRRCSTSWAFAQKGGMSSLCARRRVPERLNQFRIDTQVSRFILSCDLVVGRATIRCQTLIDGRTRIVPHPRYPHRWSRPTIPLPTAHLRRFWSNMRFFAAGDHLSSTFSTSERPDFGPSACWATARRESRDAGVSRAAGIDSDTLTHLGARDRFERRGGSR